MMGHHTKIKEGDLFEKIYSNRYDMLCLPGACGKGGIGGTGSKIGSGIPSHQFHGSGGKCVR